MKIVEYDNRYEITPEPGKYIKGLYNNTLTNHELLLTKKIKNNTPEDYIEISEAEAKMIQKYREMDSKLNI